MNKFVVIAVTILLIGIGQSEANRCKRAMQFCNVTNVDTGLFEIVEYNTCVQLCCGTKLYERDVNLVCCGTEEFGAPYNTATEQCCTWNYGKEYSVYNKTVNGQCCGSEFYTFDPAAPQSCCSSYLNKPQLFSSTTEMCCAGIVGFAGDTAYTSCCGETAYDRRVASCPCHDGKVILTPDVGGRTQCCRLNNGTTIPYDEETQGCCYEGVYDIATQTCCGRTVSDKATEACCGDVIVARDASLIGLEVMCCTLNDGTPAVYDSSTQICCGGVVQDRIANTTQICCAGVLFDSAQFGDRCCGEQPYFSADAVCCNGTLSVGDRCCGNVGFNGAVSVCCGGLVTTGNRCCGNVGFNSADGVCCGGVITPGDSCCGAVGYNSADSVCCGGLVSSPVDFKYPSCCVNATYDSFVQTCCGSEIFNNPTIGVVVSHTTRCCGDYTDPRTLFPYDYNTNLCCNGNIVDISNIDAGNAVCCGNFAIDNQKFSCCDGNTIDLWYGAVTGCCNGSAINKTSTICCDNVENPYLSDSYVCCGSVSIDTKTTLCCNGVPRPIVGVSPDQYVCCGSVTIDTKTTLCCNGVPSPVVGVSPDTAIADQYMCCGSVSMDMNASICCDGVPRSLNGVPKESAICCGEGCIDGSKYFCCEGKQYEKGNDVGVDVTGLTCDALFP